jgi:hypothetical protein
MGVGISLDECLPIASRIVSTDVQERRSTMKLLKVRVRKQQQKLRQLAERRAKTVLSPRKKK